MLTSEPALVAGAATLLEEALRDNKPALATLYQTGIFYFALAYCGSNLVEISRLFHVSHASFPLESPVMIVSSLIVRMWASTSNWRIYVKAIKDRCLLMTTGNACMSS